MKGGPNVSPTLLTALSCAQESLAQEKRQRAETVRGLRGTIQELQQSQRGGGAAGAAQLALLQQQLTTAVIAKV